MSTTSPILSRSRSTMTRPRQPRTVSMLGVAMFASFSSTTSTLADPEWEVPVPVLAQASGPFGLLVERLGGILDPFPWDPALIVLRSALPAVLPDMGRSH